MGEKLSKVASVARTPHSTKSKFQINVTCHNLDPASPVRRDEYYWQYDKVLDLEGRTLEHLRTSAQSGCRFCDLLSRAHAAYYGHLQRAKLTIWLEPERPVTLWFTEGMCRDCFVDIYVPGSEATVSRGVIATARDLSSQSDSEVSFGFLINCIKRYLEMHQACRWTSHFPPIRLLHVGSAGDPIRLVEGDYGSSSSTSVCGAHLLLEQELVRTFDMRKHSRAPTENRLGRLPQGVPGCNYGLSQVGVEHSGWTAFASYKMTKEIGSWTQVRWQPCTRMLLL